MAEQDERLFNERQEALKDIGGEIAPNEEESKDESAESQENEPEKKEEVEEESEEETEENSDEDEDDESEDEEEDDEDETEEGDETETTRDFPKDSIKDMKRSFKAEIKKLEDELKAAKTPKEKTEITGDIDKFIEEQAKALGVKPEVLKKLGEVTDKMFEAKYGDKIKKIDEFEQERTKVKDTQFAQDQKQIFDTEWGKTAPIIKEKFPNATDEQVKEAQKVMDKLAHSKEYHVLPMNKILNAEIDVFTKILHNPSKKGLETGRKSGSEQDNDFEGVGDLTNKSPSEVEQIEARRAAHLNSFERDKMTLTSQDESGQIIRRQV